MNDNPCDKIIASAIFDELQKILLVGPMNEIPLRLKDVSAKIARWVITQEIPLSHETFLKVRGSHDYQSLSRANLSGGHE